MPEKVKSRWQQWADKNRDHVNAYWRNWSKTNRPRKNATQQKWRRKNLDKQKQYRDTYYEKHLRRVMLSSAKKRARQKKLPFSLTLDDVQIPTICPVLKIQIDLSPPGEKNDMLGKGRRYGPSLDRIVGSLGYVPGNVRVISWRANFIKTDATPEELRLVADFMAGG